MPRQAEANLVALIESTDDRIWSVDLEYRLIAFNRAARRGLEMAFGKQIAVGMRPDEFLPPTLLRLAPALRARVKRWAVSEGIPVRQEPLRRAFTQPNCCGRQAGRRIGVRQRHHCAEGYRRIAFVAGTIVESSEDAIHSVNLDGTVISWNRGAETLFGYMREEIIGKSIATLAPPGRGAEVAQLLGLIANGGSVSPFSTVLLRNKEGRDVDVSLSLSAIRDLAGMS